MADNSEDLTFLVQLEIKFLSASNRITSNNRVTLEWPIKRLGKF